MESAHQPASLAVHGCLSPRFRSDSRASDFYYKSADRPLSVAAVSPVECLPDTHHPLLTTHSPLTTFRINTCKSVSKQRTLTPSRINTYKNTGEGYPCKPPVYDHFLVSAVYVASALTLGLVRRSVNYGTTAWTCLKKS